MSAQRIGFVGLGAMGRFMARNLARHIHSIGLPPLTVYNRTRSKCEDLQKDVGIDSISVANSLEEVARSCDVILTNLANDSVVKAVYSEFKQALTGFKFERNKTFVETSTCYPTFLEDLEAFMDELPLTNLIASPVFGAPAAADKAQLVIVMAGDQRVKGELAKLLVPSMGRKIIDVGGSIRKAPTLKLIGNSVVIGCLEVISEALTLGEKAGIDVFAIVGVLKDLFPNTPIASYAEIIANNAFDGNKTFAIDNGLKDAGHIRSLAAEYNSPMPATDLAHQHMLTARALHTAQKAEGTQKFDVLSFAALVAGPRAAAGLNGLDSSEDIKVEKEK